MSKQGDAYGEVDESLAEYDAVKLHGLFAERQQRITESTAITVAIESAGPAQPLTLDGLRCLVDRTESWPADTAIELKPHVTGAVRPAPARITITSTDRVTNNEGNN